VLNVDTCFSVNHLEYLLHSMVGVVSGCFDMELIVSRKTKRIQYCSRAIYGVV
jgi:hypothetical protein